MEAIAPLASHRLNAYLVRLNLLKLACMPTRPYLTYLLFLATLLPGGLLAQPSRPAASPATTEAHIRFLAADELAGRQPGHPGHALAARYLATHFQAYGVQPLPGLDGYYQSLPFQSVQPPQQGHISWDDHRWAQGEDLLTLNGPALTGRQPAVFAGYGWVSDSTDDYHGLDLQGKVAVVWLGLPGTQLPPGRILEASQRKRQLAMDRGAVGLIELYNLPYPWARARGYFGRPGSRVAPPETDVPLFHAWLHDPEAFLLQAFRAETPVTLDLATQAVQVQRFTAPNVVGYIPGRDSALRDEYLVLSAHYDHVGTGGEGPDTIFNGARDNAIGVAGLLAAAEYFAADPPRRSIILLACTAEEMGMLGSLWFVQHPPLPLEQIVFNLNHDGAGYNDTTRLTAIGYQRTGIASLVDESAFRMGLGVIADPMPEQNLFDRSDNVAFAQAGIPCLSFSPGVTEMDETIIAHYHQPSDEAEGLNFGYIHQLNQAYLHLARLIANRPQRPFWTPEDPYYEAGLRRYGKP